MAVRLVVGLGNPGREYEWTRHNIGFHVLDRLSQKGGWAFKGGRGEFEEGISEGVRYLKPLTFMNCSGTAVQQVSSYYKILPEEILVIVDDVYLPLGRLRIRRSGSAGGHNGLKSIAGAINSEGFGRIRCGVGEESSGGRLEERVLEKFNRVELSEAKAMVDLAAEAILCCQNQGIEIAMNSFNGAEDNKL